MRYAQRPWQCSRRVERSNLTAMMKKGWSKFGVTEAQSQTWTSLQEDRKCQDTSVDARIRWLRNPMQAPPICKSRLQSEANHKCITGVGSETVHGMFK